MSKNKNFEWFTKDSFQDGVFWLFIQTILALMPLWGVALIYLLYNHDLRLIDFTGAGEFVLYSASFAAGGFYSIRTDVFPFKKWVNIILVLIAVIASGVFTAISTAKLGIDAPWIRPNESMIIVISLLVFFPTLLVCFLVTVAESGKAGFNVEDIHRRQTTDIQNDLDKLLGSSK